MLWSEKYAPKRIDEFCGNASAVEQIKKWALDWERGKPGKPLLLWGPPGTGKRAVVSALAGTMGWEIVEMNASDLRDKESVHRIIGAASSSTSLFGARKLIFIDDVDAIAGNADRGGASAVVEVLKTSENPVIVTGRDFWNRELSNIRLHCTGVEFKKVNAHSIVSLLLRISESEKVKLQREVAERIAEASNGDIRSAINDLQAVAEGKESVGIEDLSVLSERDREKSIWDAVKTLMKTTRYDEATQAMWGLDVEPDMFIKWVEENVPAEYTERKDLARAFDALSRADIFAGRIHSRQYWGFLRYFNVLVTAGVALAKDRPYAKFVKYSFPAVLKKLSSSKTERARIKAVGMKIGARCHASSSEAVELFLPLIKILMEKENCAHVPAIAAYFGFDAADVAFILGKSETQAEKLLGGESEKKHASKGRKAAK